LTDEEPTSSPTTDFEDRLGKLIFTLGASALRTGAVR
jgi:hypothetical protein